MRLIELQEIHKKYNIGKPSEVHAIKGIDLYVEKGEMVSIVGTSGSGKSSLLHLIGCLDTATSGEYILDGENINLKTNKEIAQLRNQKIGFVLQDFGLILNKSVMENISLPLIFGKTNFRDIKKTCMEKLEMIGIPDLAKRPVEQLSGGQKQRVAIARALVNEPDIILADEPTGALDSNTTKDILKIFSTLNQYGKTIILVTHDIDVASICTRMVRIEDGKIED